MTNNPTIDGVSRELFHAAACRLSDLGQSHISEPMFAILLDSPAVERQPIKNASEVAYNLQAENARLEAQLNNAINLDFQRRERITQLESEKEFAAVTYQAARDRIAELESGRGEPVAWMRTDIPGMCIAAEVKAHNLKIGGAPAKGVEGYNVPLYAAPPARVAVVLPELESSFEKWWEEDGQYCRSGGGSYEKTFAYRAYEAALNATAALNGVKS